MFCHILSSHLFSAVVCAVAAPQARPIDSSLQACGDAYYSPSKYTCYEGNFLCPVENGVKTLRCGGDCYLPDQYSCSNSKLVQGPGTASAGTSNGPFGCAETATGLHLSDPPYENYFYSDCHSATQVVVTSPLSDSNLTFIGPRLLVAWPAGNSGLVAFFAPQNGANGSLSISLENGTNSQSLQGVYQTTSGNSSSSSPVVGISTLLHFNDSATLTVPIIGSIRNIRDFTEGPSILVPLIQNSMVFSDVKGAGGNDGAQISRMWLDNQTISTMSFLPHDGGGEIKRDNQTLKFSAGTYNFTARFNYPQLTQLAPTKVLNEQSQDIITQNAEQAKSLSFLSYSDKLLAGAWRFLTYFGRDSMISYLLMEPILSSGNSSATEAVIAAVLERINRTDGSVCHEETIGDYSTYLNLQKNITSTAPGCTYPMVDADYYLAVTLERYYQSPIGKARMADFLATTAKLDFGNAGLSYSELLRFNAEKVMNSAAAFAQPGGQTKDNLVHLKSDQIVGEWRDSTYGIGGGRIPYDVNTALVPAALRSIAALASAGLFPAHPDWNSTASSYAKVWEDSTLPFFAVSVPTAEARQLVDNYTSTANLGFPSHSDLITSDIAYHGLALDGNDNQTLVKVMNSDDCFRLYFVNSTEQSQLTSFVNTTANNINAPFPVGLVNDVGLLVANPAYGGDPVYAANFTYNAYHGTVVWGWPMAMMAAGLERQLDRCTSTAKPDFCTDQTVHGNVVAAYNRLWDVIEANTPVLSNEVWSWQYQGGKFNFEALGALPPPAGSNPTESNVRQLWSLTFLAVKRNESLK